MVLDSVSGMMERAVVTHHLRMRLGSKMSKFFARGPPPRPSIFSFRSTQRKHRARLLRKMRDILAREEGPMNRGTATNLTPSAASSYFLTVLLLQYKDRLTLRTSRELRTTAKALDLLAQGRSDRAGDVLAQRYKALELFLADQTWSRAQFLELIPPEGASLVEKDEMLMASKEQTVEQKMRATIGTPQWRAPHKGDGKGDEKGKSKGKGRGKKGRGPVNSWTHQQESEKPPVA